MAKVWKIQVQAQFDVQVETFDEASDMAVEIAMQMDSTEWGTVELKPVLVDA